MTGWWKCAKCGAINGPSTFRCECEAGRRPPYPPDEEVS